ncbi:hypothetical protein ACHWQZ_G006788 [Mnemiopsis leidyi]
MKLPVLITLLVVAAVQAQDCTEGFTKCADGVQCIKEEYWCDGGDPDCDDRSDEVEAVCREYQCTADYAKCGDGTHCTAVEYFCDGAQDCADGSDEADCKGGYVKDGKCEDADVIMCNDGLQCVLDEFWCSGQKAHCDDKSDEADSTCLRYTCLEGYVKCKDGKQCIKESYLCDEGIPDCHDGSDEENC